MHYKNRRRYEMLARVDDFGATYGRLFPESTLAAHAFATVRTAVEDIEASEVDAAMASVSARATRKQDIRRALRERLMLLVRTARALPDADPDFKAHFTLPRSHNDQLLLTAARRCQERAAERTAEFVLHGLRSTFADDLKEWIARFEAALRDRGTSRVRYVEARGRITQTLARALKATAQLDAIVANQFTDDAIVRGVWKNARRIVYVSKPSRSA